MNSNRVKEIKKEDKKAFKSFIIIMIISAIAGGILGGMSIYFKDSLSENLTDFIMNILEAITPFASVVLSLLVIITSSIVYKKLTWFKKIPYRAWQLYLSYSIINYDKQSCQSDN